MIRGYALTSDGRTEMIASIESAGEAVRSGASALWLDLEAPGRDDLATLGNVFGFSVESIEDCYKGEQRPRVDEYDDYAFLILYGVVGPEEPAVLSPRKVGVFVNEHYIITVHMAPLITINDLHRRCERHAANVLGRGTDFFLYLFIDGIVDRILDLTNAYETRIEEVEDASLSPEAGASILSRVTDLRHDLLDLRQLASAQRDVLLPMRRGEYAWISRDDELRFNHVVDHITTALEIINSLRDLLAGVRDNYHSVLAERMNEIIKTLTIFATILLPLSLIAGIYGMNVALWPGPENPYAFWGILCVMGAVVLGLVAYFRRQGWF